MDNKFKYKIIASLRKLSFSWPPRNEVKKKAKVFAATFECAECGIYCYDGTSDKTLEKASESLSKPVVRRKVHVDHVEPVSAHKGFTTWDNYINSLFCDIDNLQLLCENCHKLKSKKERSVGRSIKEKK